jgi:hypothetical protein
MASSIYPPHAARTFYTGSEETTSTHCPNKGCKFNWIEGVGGIWRCPRDVRGHRTCNVLGEQDRLRRERAESAKEQAEQARSTPTEAERAAMKWGFLGPGAKPATSVTS